MTDWRSQDFYPHPCFGCGERVHTKHFSLTIMQEHPSRSRIDAGVIDLCKVCWRQANESARIRKRPDLPF